MMKYHNRLDNENTEMLLVLKSEVKELQEQLIVWDFPRFPRRMYNFIKYGRPEIYGTPTLVSYPMLGIANFTAIARTFHWHGAPEGPGWDSVRKLYWHERIGRWLRAFLKRPQR